MPFRSWIPTRWMKARWQQSDAPSRAAGSNGTRSEQSWHPWSVSHRCWFCSGFDGTYELPGFKAPTFVKDQALTEWLRSAERRLLARGGRQNSYKKRPCGDADASAFGQDPSLLAKIMNGVVGAASAAIRTANLFPLNRFQMRQQHARERSFTLSTLPCERRWSRIGGLFTALF